MDEFTLDQFTVFVTIVEQGGFAAAARKLNRAQSAITYAIKALESQSGLQLFDRSAYRAQLTDAGRALLPRARRLLDSLDDYRRQAQSFAAGLEANISMVMDEFVATSHVKGALAALHLAHPSVRVRLILEAPLTARDLIKSGQAQLGLLTQFTPFGTELEATHWTEHDLVAVAAPSHPLALLPGPIEPNELRGHMQVVWTTSAASATSTDSPDHGIHAMDCWHVTDMRVKRELLLEGVGWGSLPDHYAAADLTAGRLVRLNLQAWEGSNRMPRYTTAISWRRDVVLGPAIRQLITALIESAATFGGRSNP